jgi:DNA-binding PadR family transcriptional regulator
MNMESYDLNELNPLQIFLLVLVEFGLSTPYALLSKAGMGPGLTSPALRRLKEAGLLTGTSGPRNRVRYAITKKGANLLRESLKSGDANYWQLGQTDMFESLPRGIILAWLHAGVDEAHKGVARAADNTSIVARKRQRDAEELHASIVRLQADMLKDDSATARGMLIATAYQWIKAECDAALFRMQVEVIGKIDRLLPTLPPAPQVP